VEGVGDTLEPQHKAPEALAPEALVMVEPEQVRQHLDQGAPVVAAEQVGMEHPEWPVGKSVTEALEWNGHLVLVFIMGVVEPEQVVVDLQLEALVEAGMAPEQSMVLQELRIAEAVEVVNVILTFHSQVVLVQL
jgi:hypothetical protein